MYFNKSNQENKQSFFQNANNKSLSNTSMFGNANNSSTGTNFFGNRPSPAQLTPNNPTNGGSGQYCKKCKKQVQNLNFIGECGECSRTSTISTIWCNNGNSNQAEGNVFNNLVPQSTNSQDPGLQINDSQNSVETQRLQPNTAQNPEIPTPVNFEQQSEPNSGDTSPVNFQQNS